MKPYQINIIVSLLLGVTALLISIMSTESILAAIIFGLAIIEATIGIAGCWKNRVHRIDRE